MRLLLGGFDASYLGGNKFEFEFDFCSLVFCNRDVLIPEASTTTVDTIATETAAPQAQTTTATGPAAPTVTNSVPNANSNCTEGTAFGWVSGSPYAPSSATRWAIKIGPISPGTYTANLALGASSYKSSSTGSCLTPGGCGTAAGTVSFTLSSSGMSATYSIVGGWAIMSHVFYSCSAVSFVSCIWLLAVRSEAHPNPLLLSCG